jgi:hypothetical protein
LSFKIFNLQFNQEEKVKIANEEKIERRKKEIETQKSFGSISIKLTIFKIETELF